MRLVCRKVGLLTTGYQDKPDSNLSEVLCGLVCEKNGGYRFKGRREIASIFLFFTKHGMGYG
jgi:hypothetical protein